MLNFAYLSEKIKGKVCVGVVRLKEEPKKKNHLSGDHTRDSTIQEGMFKV